MQLFSRDKTREKRIVAMESALHEPFTLSNIPPIAAHPAIKSFDGGERLEVEINFKEGSPRCILRTGGEYSFLQIDQKILGILPRYANTARSLQIAIFFPTAPISTQFSRASETYIRTLSNLVNSFQNAENIQVAAEVAMMRDPRTGKDDFVWDQLKNMIYFYRCTVENVRLYIAAGEGMEWRLVEKESPLHRRLMSHKEGLVNEEAFSDIGS